MPRQSQEYRAIHSAADKIEPRMARAYVRSTERLREPISIDELAIALSLKNVNAAIKLIPDERVEDVLSPMGTIVQDTTLKGGRIGAEVVNSG